MRGLILLSAVLMVAFVAALVLIPEVQTEQKMVEETIEISGQ